jgi:hypothetical protein
MVTTENYEEYMMLDADGELDSVGRQALQAFIAANPALKAEYATWQSLKLQPEPSLTFPGKEALLKRERKGLVLIWKSYTLAAAAAMAAAAILIPALWKSGNEHVRIVHTFPLKTGTEPPMADQSRKPAASLIDEAQDDQSRTRDQAAQSVASVRQSDQPRRVAESIAALDIVSQELAVQAPVIAPQPVIQEAALVVGPEEPQRQTAGLPRIQFAQENRQAFDLLKKALEERVEQASSVAKSVKETAFVIKLGNGVNINF